MSLTSLRSTLQVAIVAVAGSLLTGCGTDDENSNGNTIISSRPDPLPTPAPILSPEPSPDPATFEEQILAAVNIARATARNCGSNNMPAVAALAWNGLLQQAAFIHSSNMANYDFFSHTGLDGKDVEQRLQDEGYTWQASGENIAAGQVDITAVMENWLASPAHCSNIMSASYTEMGAASVTNLSTQYNIYWTQVFAAPL